MDRLTIDRGPSTDQGTAGTAELNNPAGITLWTGVSGELPWRNNASNLSCIPPGIYVATYSPSALFKRNVYHLQNVPGRSAVEIHIGNWFGDTTLGFKSDVLGCTVVGTVTGRLAGQLAVENSETAYNALVAATGGADIEVEYRWTDGNTPS